MSDGKKYYYLKLKENFFDSDEMVILESMPDGYLYSNILLKLYCRSLKREGKLMFNDTVPYNAQILAKLTRHPEGVIEKAIKTFKQLGLIELLNNGAIYMTAIQNFIGKSSTEADRIRSYRNQISTEKESLENNILEQSVQMYDKRTPELELELELELERKRESEREKLDVQKTERLFNGKPLSFYYEKVQLLFNNTIAITGSVPKMREVTKPRKSSIANRTQDTFKSLEQWRIYFEWITCSAFLMEECNGRGFDFYTRPKIIVRIKEGEFHESGSFYDRKEEK